MEIPNIWTDQSTEISFEDSKSTSMTSTYMGQLLIQYAKEGNTDKVKEVIIKGSPLAVDALGISALHYAVLGNHIATSEVLIKAGVSVDLRTKVDRTPLHLAVYEGHMEAAQMLLKHDCEVNPLDMLRMTPLHWAVEKNHLEIVRLLLEHGADPEGFISKFLRTPRSIAVANQFFDALELFDQHISKYGKLKGIISSQTKSQKVIKTEKIEELIDTDDQDELDIIDYDDGCGSTDDNCDVGNEEYITDDVKGTGYDDEDDVGSADYADAAITESDDGCVTLNENIAKLGNIRELKNVDLSALKILQDHGISMIPSEDEDTLIVNALQSGRKIVLSEAGKYFLNRTRLRNPFSFTATTSDLPESSDSILQKTIATSSRQIENKPVIASKSVHTSKYVSVDTNKDNSVDKAHSINGTRTTSIEVVCKKGVLKRGAPPTVGEEYSVLAKKQVRNGMQEENNCDAETEETAMGSTGINNRFMIIEQKLERLQKENEGLRHKLELAHCMIAENRKRIEELESVDPRNRSASFS